MNASILRLKDRINEAWAKYQGELENASVDVVVAAIQHLRKQEKKNITSTMIMQTVDTELKIVLPYEICDFRVINQAVDEVDYAYVEFGPDGMAVINFTDAR